VWRGSIVYDEQSIDLLSVDSRRVAGLVSFERFT